MTGNFVHLHVHSEYSLLDGAARIDRLVDKAKSLGMPALAITDHGVMYGVTDFYNKAVKSGIKPIIGCEIYVAPGSMLDKKASDKANAYHLVLLAENNKGYHNLMKIVSEAYLDGFYYKPRADKELLKKYSEGIICLSACLAGEVPVKILGGDMEGARKSIEDYIDIFGKENFFLEVQNHFLPEDSIVNPKIKELAAEYGLGTVATNDSHYVDAADSEAQDILLCIQTNHTVFDEDRMKFSNDEFYFKSAEEMRALFPDDDEVIENTLKIAQRCNVELEFGKLLLPNFDTGEGETAQSQLEKLCYSAFPLRYDENDSVAKERLEFELATINKTGYGSYFLIVNDFVAFAKNNGISVGPGRGSAAGSIVSYLLGITSIDPLKYDLLFERFLNPDRISMPDIDIDFCYERRQEVFDYIVEKYGQEKVARIITFGTLAARAAIKDVGRALNIPLGEVEKVSKLIPSELDMTLDKALSSSVELRELVASNPQMEKLFSLAKALEGTPRNSSVHAAGLVIAPSDLEDYVPLQRTADDSVVTQYDKDKVEEVGLLKIDLLGLRTLTIIANAVKMIKENQGVDIDIDNIELKDKKTADMLKKGKTAGIFQMESAGMTQMVKDLAPEGFEDMIPLVALYRPGPLGTGMSADFINLRHGRGKIDYLHPRLEHILKSTFGVVLYQEQVMQIASELSGFTLAQADILRKAMGKKNQAQLAAQRDAFVEGAVERGVGEKKAKDIFTLLENFAGYGFNKSHSACYALVAWRTAWLKAHYPVEFMAALLTNEMTSNSKKVGQYIEVCKQMDINVLPPDINVSVDAFSVDGGNIRFGLAAVKNVGEAAIECIIKARRKGGEFKSMLDFCKRTDMRSVNKRVIESLIKAGSFDSMGKRSQLLAVVDDAVNIAAQSQKDEESGQLGLFGEGEASFATELDLPKLDEMAKEVMLSQEKEYIGFYVTGHPLDKFRDIMIDTLPISSLQEGFKDNERVVFAGIISSCKRMTDKKGEAMATLTLEDFSSTVDVLVFHKVFEKVSAHVALENTVQISGTLRGEKESPKLVAENIESLSEIDSPFKIVIPKGFDNKTVYMNLKKSLLKYPGKSTVLFELISAGQLIRASEHIRVDAGNEKLRAEIENILQEKN